MSQDKRHSVKATLQVVELTRAGSAITLEVYGDGLKLGTIEIGQGSFGWKPVSGKRIRRKSWTDFEAFMHHNWR